MSFSYHKHTTVQDKNYILPIIETLHLFPSKFLPNSTALQQKWIEFLKHKKRNKMRKILMLSIIAISSFASQRYALAEMNGVKEQSNGMDAFIIVENNQVYGRSFCNSFFGAINAQKTIESVGSTMMVCPVETMDKERAFLNAFNNSKITISENKVEVSNKNSRLIFEVKK